MPSNIRGRQDGSHVGLGAFAGDAIETGDVKEDED